MAERARVVFEDPRFAVLPYFIIPLFLIVTTLEYGVPAVRHDWAWPVEPAAFRQAILDWTSGWDVAGLGRPKTITSYLLALPIFAVGVIAGSEAALAAYLCLIGVTMAFACAQLRRRYALTPLATVAVSGAIVANPWVYSELVAGHLGMLLAYGSVVVLWTELVGPDFDRRRGVLAFAGASFQPQFFILAWIACATRLRERAPRAALGIGTIFFLPYALGIAAHVASVAATPLTLPWERVQSVPLLQAVLLRGYFTGYARGFDGVRGTVALAAFAGMAWFGICCASRDVLRRVGLPTVVTLGVASGTRGPFGALVSFGFTHLPAFGLFRELYDLIGIVAAGYTIAYASVLMRFKAFRWVGSAAAVLLLGAWFKAPPATLWVPSSTVPPLALDSAAPNGRYALVPPFQPLSFHDQGSGIDPAALYQTLLRTPLNTYGIQYPESSALASYGRTGDAAGLARLGATAVVCRDGFTVDAAAAAGRGAAANRSGDCSRANVPVPSPNAIVSLQETAGICTLCTAVGNGDVFDGDAGLAVRDALGLRGSPATYRRLSSIRDQDDPRAGWIDARIAFVNRPDIAQPFGGAFTLAGVTFPWPGAAFALVDVRGRLFDQSGRTVAKDTAGYRWTRIPATTRSLRCDGACAIALESDERRTETTTARPQSRPLAWNPLAPWLLMVSLPAGRTQVVRYLETYDDFWIGIVDGRLARHLRLDATINGWIVPPRAHAAQMVVVNVVDLLQVLLEACAFIALVASVSPRRERPRETER